MVIIVFEEEDSWCLSLKSFLEHCGWEIKNSPFFLCVWGVGKGDVLGGG